MALCPSTTAIEPAEFILNTFNSYPTPHQSSPTQNLQSIGNMYPYPNHSDSLRASPLLLFAQAHAQEWERELFRAASPDHDQQNTTLARWINTQAHQSAECARRKANKTETYCPAISRMRRPPCGRKELASALVPKESTGIELDWHWHDGAIGGHGDSVIARACSVWHAGKSSAI